MNAPLPKKLGEALLDMGLLSSDQLRIALLEQDKSGLPLGKQLVGLGFVSETALRDALSENLGRASVDLAHAMIDPAALSLLPQETAQSLQVLPLHYDAARRVFVLAAADCHDLPGQDRIREMLRLRLGTAVELEILLAGESEIGAAIDRHYGYALSIDDILAELENQDLESAQGQSGPSVVRLIDNILIDAVKEDASDIHFEPEENFLRIRYRQDGILRQIRALHKKCWPAMAVRLKVISGMNIAESRAPQDGRVTFSVSGRPVDFRASCQPTLHGENIVFRVLDRQKGIVPLERLGISERAQARLEQLLARPEGVILLTGPTGSGKTTSLYAILNQINSERINIMTLEDPVEYPLPLIRQTSMNEALRMDFAGGVRAMLRQDPDVILVGEIRDADTAVMAFRAAMTGHRVFATLHSNSAIGAIPRLLDIGVTPEIISGNLTGVIAQRLLRRLCPHCKRAVTASPDECRLLDTPDDQSAPQIYQPVGCAQCRFTGYRGRLPILEILRIDNEADELIARRATQNELLHHARQQGFQALAEDGLDKVRSGVTTLEELARVVDLSDRIAWRRAE
ncbi:MAG: Flp pilus assembly complex ATPase component TadA [Zoogloeaceae bacterium]|jgi:general secretion pathway protein E/type IV pilus assembly protein PilB|nr:Flp pilus assembly complex ATPase component TadA [Zoogloeaceae bacterium]